MFRQAVRHPLVKIVADAGFGKTLAFSGFIKQVDAVAYIVSLTELDDLPHHFWERFVRAVCVSDDEIASEMIHMGFPEAHVAFELVLRMLNRIFPSGHRIIIVLDDFHLIQNPSVTRFVERLIHERPDLLSVILSSRKEPAIETTSLMAKEMCFAISGVELCFTEDETADYFRQCGVIIQKADLKHLIEYTGGWPIAVYLAGLYVQKGGGHDFGFAKTIGQDLSALIDNEIFKRYDLETRDSLVAISILSKFEPKMVSAVTSLKKDLLAELCATTLFIRKNASDGAYTIHHLFLQFLRDKFVLLDESKQARYHKRAAKWLVGNKRVFEAVEHFKACGEYGKMLDALEGSPDNVSTADKCKFIIDVVETLPENVLSRRMVTQVAYGGLLFMAGRLTDANTLLQNIFEKSRNTKFKTPIIHNLIMGEVYMLDGIIGYFDKDKDYVTSFKQAAKLIPDGSKLLNDTIHFTQGNPSMFIVFNERENEVERVQDMLTEAAPYTKRVLHGANAGFDVLFGAEAAYYRGDFIKARQLADKCIHLAKQFSQHTIELDADFVLLQTHMACGEKSKAKEILDKMKRKATVLNEPLFSTMVSIMHSWTCITLGEFEEVSKWIEDGDMESGENLGIGAWMEHFLHARLLLARKNFYALEAFLPVLDFICIKRRGFLLNRIEYHVLAALLAFGCQDMAGCEKALLRVYELSHKNNILMPIASYGSDMKKMLAAVKKTETTIPADWLTHLITMSDDYHKVTRGAVAKVEAVFGLTPKELDVLRQLCESMTNQEIGKRLKMKETTVKWYVNQIISKMGVKNRTEAALEAVRHNVF